MNVSSPVRNRMTENDLDSPKIGDEIVVRNRHLHVVSSQLDRQGQNNQNLYPQTQQNFYRN